MADIFLSYAREDVNRAGLLERRLEEMGWSVFRDREMPSGTHWPRELQAELDKARCVVVLWTENSIYSDWVKIEAGYGLQKGILRPVLGEKVDPPADFEQVQAPDLSDWTGGSDSFAYQGLVRAITNLIGGHSALVLHPVQVVLVTGEQAAHPHMGPTINMECRIENTAAREVRVKRLEMIVTISGEELYHMSWSLGFESTGLLHSKLDQQLSFSVAGRSKLAKGIQLLDPDAEKSSIWQSGSYEFEILGWANRTPSKELADIVTRFRGDVTYPMEALLKHWRNADSNSWDRFGDRDRAIGSELLIEDVIVGL